MEKVCTPPRPKNSPKQSPTYTALRRSPRKDASKDTTNSSYGEKHMTNVTSSPSKPKKHCDATKGTIENGMPHDKDGTCNGKDADPQPNIETEKAVDAVDHSRHETVSNETTPVRLRTCKSCLSNEASENGTDNLEPNDGTEHVKCDKCQKENLIEDSVNQETDSKVNCKNVEQCPMCDMVFESAEFLDDHLLSPESCSKNSKKSPCDEVAAKDPVGVEENSTQPNLPKDSAVDGKELQTEIVGDNRESETTAVDKDLINAAPAIEGKELTSADDAEKSPHTADDDDEELPSTAAVAEEKLPCAAADEEKSQSVTADEKSSSIVADNEEQITKDNNNEDNVKSPVHEDHGLTLDGSVVDEMEDTDQELQQLAEEFEECDSKEHEVMETNEDNVVIEGEQEESMELDESTSEDKVSGEVDEKKDTVEETDKVVVSEVVSSSKPEENVPEESTESQKKDESELSTKKNDDEPGVDHDLVEGEDKIVVQHVYETSHDESVAERSPEIMCNEIVEEHEVADGPEGNVHESEEIPVPVAAIPATATMVLTNDEEPKEKSDDSPSKRDATVEKPKIPQPADCQKPADGKKSEVIEIVDSDSDQGASEKKETSAKVEDLKGDDPKGDNRKEDKTKETTKSDPAPDAGSEKDNKSDDDASKGDLLIKTRFTTGNETLDQDVVEILQDATQKGVRVTRSMRNKKQQVDKDAAEVGKKTGTSGDDKKRTNEEVSPSKGQSISCKLVTCATGQSNIKQGTVSNKNGALTLQVPVTSVQSGAKFIITIPENNNSDTPPGKYLITVPPSNPASGEPPAVKSIKLRASPLKTSPQPIRTMNTSASTNIASLNTSSAASSSDMSKLPGLLNDLSDIETDTAKKMQLRKTVMVAKQTKKVYVKELEEIDDVIFECPKCKLGFPHMLLVQLHMEDCCHHPPTQRPTLHMRIPTEILLKFFEKVPHVNRQNYKCICCQEILTYRRYRLGKYYPLIANHFSKHTSPPVKVVNFTDHSQMKELGDALTVHSKQAIEWVDHMVPPFTLSNQPVSSKFGTLDDYLCTGNKLHQESLLLLEYDSDELEEEMYLMRKQKEKKKRRGRHAKNATTDYVCNWKAAIVKEETNVVEVNEVGTPKSAFPDFHKSGSLKHSILHSPSKALSDEQKKKANQKPGSKKKKDKSKKDVSKQLFVDNINRRRSPRKEGVGVFLSLPQKRTRGPSLERTTSKRSGSEDDIILLSSEEDSQQGIQSKESESGAQTVGKPKPGKGTLSHQGSVDDDSSRSSFPSLSENAAKSKGGVELPKSAADKEDDDRPPSRGSSIICLSDSNEEEESEKKKEEQVAKPVKKTQPASTKSVTQKAAQNNAAQGNNEQKTTTSTKVKPVSVQGNVDMQKEVVQKAEVKKRLVPEPEIDEEITVLSDVEDEEEDECADWRSDNYDPILLDKHQVKTYFQMSREEQGIYECSLGGCSSCDCVAESDLFEHLRQHIIVERVHPQKRSKTILFKGKVVPQYLKLTRHQIWAHFNNVTVNEEMEICDEYMQQYKQCRWGSCGQRVWTKYGRLSHHLRSHLRFTQIDDKRYCKMRELQKISDSDSSKIQAVLQSIPVRPKPSVRPKVLEGDEVVCLPEDVILTRYKYGKSPSKNVRGIFSCLDCSYSHHLDANASAVMTVKILACHLKQHLPQNLVGHSCLITPKAMKPKLQPDIYATKIKKHLPSSCQEVDSIKDLPEGIIALCYDMLRMKVVELAVIGTEVPLLNKDGVLYRCLHSGCHIGVVGKQKMALLKHIKDHKPDLGDKIVQSKGGPVQQHTQPTPSQVIPNESLNRKRKTLYSEQTNPEAANGTLSKQRKISDGVSNVQQCDADDASSDGDIIELIDDSSQDETSQVCSENQQPESASQEDSQESTTGVTMIDSDNSAPATGTNLPEWSTTNRGVSNAVTGIEPSRDNPSRSMDELRQNPNDVIVCSMPDVEAYFCEHIVKYSSIVSPLSDKVTFGKPSYSCPECLETGLRGVALKQHLENHIGKTIKWKSLTRNPSDLDSGIEQDLSPLKPVSKSKRSSRVLTPHRMKLSPRKWEGKNSPRYNSKHQVRLVGQGVRRARQSLNSVLSRILTRERNIRWGKLSRSPIKRLSPFKGSRTLGRNIHHGNTPIRNLDNDLSPQVKQGHQSSSTKDADIVKQSQDALGEQQIALPKQLSDESCNSKSDASQATEVIDLVDESASDIMSVGSDDMEENKVVQKGQANMSVDVDESQEDDLFLTLEDILKEHFTKEEKQKSRKGTDGIVRNFVIVQYKCRRCNFTCLTVLDVPEHIALHIKRKVILKIKMDK